MASTVTSIARRRAGLTGVTSVPLDYRDDEALSAGLARAVEARGPLELAVCWIHTDAPAAPQLVATALAPGARLVQVFGTRVWPLEDVPLHVAYRRALLGPRRALADRRRDLGRRARGRRRGPADLGRGRAGRWSGRLRRTGPARGGCGRREHRGRLAAPGSEGAEACPSRKVASPRRSSVTETLRPASWDEALDTVAAAFARAREADASTSFGIFSCSKATNETNFLAQKLARQVMGSNNVDS